MSLPIPDSLISLQSERNILGGIINHPNAYIDVSNFLDDSCFVGKEHRIIFSILKNMVLDGNKLDRLVLSQKVQSLGIKMDLDVFEYIDAISSTQIQPDGIKDLSQELLRLKVMRELWGDMGSIQAYLKDCNNDPIDKIIGHVDKIYNQRVSGYVSESEPVDLYANIEDYLRKIAANPVDEAGMVTPFKKWNDYFGGLISKDGIYNIISRAGEGKSCMLFNMAKGVAKLNNIKVLYLDTEMSLDMNMLRAAAAEFQVNSWYLKTGQWTKNPAMAKQVLSGFEDLKKYKGSIHHLYVPNKDIYELLSIMKRWYYKNVGRGNKCLFVYDYLKITSDFDKNRAEWQLLGDKVSYLNEFGYNMDSPVFSAGQQNRQGQTQGGGRNDDSTTAGASDRINQYAAFNAVFRGKSFDEMNEQGLEFGSHILKPFKYSRTQGKEDYNKHKTVRIVKPSGQIEYQQNFINYEISEYDIREKGTYEDVVKQRQLQGNLQPNNNSNNNNQM